MRRYLTTLFATVFLTATVACADQAQVDEDALYRKGLIEVMNLSDFFCNNIYPKPKPTECIEKIKHAIGQSADVHSQYLSPAEMNKTMEGMTGQFAGVGIQFNKVPTGISNVVVMDTIEGGPAQRVGILTGDVITHIITSAKGAIPSISLKTDEVVALLRGEPGTTVTVRVTRKSVAKPLEFTLTREIIKIAQVEGELIIHGGKTYALIKNKVFNSNNAKEVETKFAELKKKAGAVPLAGLILSFEGNPGGLLNEAHGVIKLFVETTKDLILMRTNDGIEPYISFANSQSGKNGDITKGLPILAIVDGKSASASEVVTMALQHNRRAVIAGTSGTFGKGIVQSFREGRDGSAVKLTTSEYLIGSLLDWVPVQCTGVVPDVLFEYPGIKKPERLQECEISGHVNTLGPMQNPPVRPSLKDANPRHYQVSLDMLEAYKRYKLPLLQKEEALRKELEKIE